MTTFWHACDKPHMFTFDPKTSCPGWFKVLPLREDPIALASLNEIMAEACSNPKATFADMESLTRRLLNTSDPIGRITRHGGISEGLPQYLDAIVKQTRSIYSEEMLAQRDQTIRDFKEDVPHIFRGRDSVLGGLVWSGYSALKFSNLGAAPHSPTTMRRIKADIVGFRGTFRGIRPHPLSLDMWKMLALTWINEYIHTHNLSKLFQVDIIESYQATSPILCVWYGARVHKDGSVRLF